MPNTILAVDDDPDIIDALAMVLKAGGYRVVSARSGAEGLAKLRLEKPDVVILDLVMPDIDGFAFRKQVSRPEWKEFHDVPILVLTAPREEAVRRRYEMDTGCSLTVDDYIEKPFVPDVLLKRIEKMISPKSV